MENLLVYLSTVHKKIAIKHKELNVHLIEMIHANFLFVYNATQATHSITLILPLTEEGLFIILMGILENPIRTLDTY